MREYYYDSRKEGNQRTDEEYYVQLEALAGDLPITSVIVDPSAASFIECIRRHGRFFVEKAANAVMAGTWPHGSNAGMCFSMPAVRIASGSLGFIGGTKRP